MKLSFHRRVQGEVNEAARWYEEQREGLGDDFFLKLIAALELIAARPEGFGFWLGSTTIRCIKMKRFPFSVLYEVRPGKVRVLCVRHDKRHPRFGSGRE